MEAWVDPPLADGDRAQVKRKQSGVFRDCLKGQAGFVSGVKESFHQPRNLLVVMRSPYVPAYVGSGN